MSTRSAYTRETLDTFVVAMGTGFRTLQRLDTGSTQVRGGVVIPRPVNDKGQTGYKKRTSETTHIVIFVKL